MSKRDYYEVLGVSKAATVAELKKAYHKLAMKYHPDRNPTDKDAEKKFKEINEAYDVLKDEQKKAAYDRYGHNAFGQQAGGSRQSGGFNPDINDIFGDFFSDFMGGNSRQQKPSSQVRGSDLKYNLTIDLEEAFNGVDKNISFNTEIKCVSCQGSGAENNSGMSSCEVCGGKGATRVQQGFFTLEQTCSKCRGAGQIIKNPCKKCNGIGRCSHQKNLLVNVPAGIEEGTRIRLLGEGEAGMRNGSAGDLYIFVNIKPHKMYKVQGSNLHCKLPISFTTAALGGELELPSIDGGKISLKIPPGTENDQQLKVKGKGMSQVRSPNRGDLFVHIYVETPKNLTKKQQELLEAFRVEIGEDKNHDANFFNKVKNLWS